MKKRTPTPAAAVPAALQLDRARLLSTLEAVSPGLSTKSLHEQSSCFCFRKGTVMTFNGRMAVRAPSGLPPGFTGAVQSEPLLKLLRRLNDDDVTFTPTETELRVRVPGTSRKGGVRMDGEIVLPIGTADRPPKDGWVELDSSFLEGLTLTHACAGKDDTDTAATCVHVHPKYLEATDLHQLIRYRVKTPIRRPFLIKKEAARHLSVLEVVALAETEAWVHFRNADGLVFSCLRYAEEFPNLGRNLNTDGAAAARMPENLKRAAEAAGDFTAENESDHIKVVLDKGRITVHGEGVSGWYSESPKIKYRGAPMEFHISPKLLAEIASRHSECFVTDDRIIVKGNRWKYSVSFISPEEGVEVGESTSRGEGGDGDDPAGEDWSKDS